ncbi:DNA polymerase I [Enterobacter phage EcpYZU01]|uniref:DNA polymerase I n=1 Tax=Enterobacter phage EcpYZU01 TaxID=2483604 RepID=UPI0018ACA108|nr:DNA polymerase I [Enterobacter phage EcpYZU01]
MIDLQNIWGSDIETDGLLDTVSQFHCGVLINAETEETLKYGVAPMVGIVGGFKEYVEKVEQIAATPEGLLVFHNGINYDVPALDILKRKYFGKRLNFPKQKMVDTLVMGRLMYPNIKMTDIGAVKAGRLPPRMMGRQSLEAWGYRLGQMKGEYKTDYVAKCKAEGIPYSPGDEWLNPSQEMLDYNVQDVVVTLALFKKFLTDSFYFGSTEAGLNSVYALRLEHDAAWTCAKMERNGFPMSTEIVEGLYQELSVKRAELLDKLRSTFGSWYQAKGGKDFFKHPRTGVDLPKYPRVVYPKVGAIFKKPKNKAQRLGLEPCEVDTRDTMVGAPFTPISYIEFNPGSGDHLAKVLMDRGWEPTEFTDTGKPKCDDEVLSDVRIADPEAQACVELVRDYLVVQKRIGQAAEGKNAWLRLVQPDGRIHGSINPCGAVTGRATHSSPNMAQVPANGAPWGEICRSAFGAQWNQNHGKPDPWIQVGVDASGLELRCLGNRAAPFDGGAYATTVVEGDIHWANAVNAGLAPNVKRDKSNHEHEAFRNNAKTFIYAFLYGAGAAKIGLIVGGGKKEGSALMKKFIEGTPAIKDLREAVQSTLISDSKWVDGENIVKWKRRWLRGLDGRRIHIRSPHSALNALLQGDGAVVCKHWIVETERMLEAEGFVHGWDGDFAYMAWVHDELQIACRTKEIADRVVEVAQLAMRKVGEFYNFKCVLDTEGKIGPTWKECH